MTPAARLRDDAVAIFLFHGVTPPGPHAVRNCTGKHLAPDTFAACLEALRRAGHAVAMDEVVAHLARGAPLPPRSFAITFDDGFRNNLTDAAPILADLGVPATFYVTTAFVEHNAMSWIDRLEHLLEHAPPGRLELPWRETPAPFASPASRVALLDEIRARVKRDPEIDVDGLVEDAFAQCGAAPVRSGDGPLDRKLSWDDVRALDAEALFTVGGHSHTHRILSFLDEPELRGEIATSLDLLRARAGVRTTHYSYPEGLAHCYSDAVIGALRDAGVACCPTAEDGVNGPRSDPFRLRRIAVAGAA